MSSSETLTCEPLTDSAKALPSTIKQRAKGKGKPVIGIEISVPETTTVIPQDGTTFSPDSTRVAAVAYHTEWASVEGTVAAPPGNAPLEVDLRLTRRAFTPLVGVYQTKDSTFIDVTGIPGTSTVTKAYTKLNPPVPRLSRTVMVGVSTYGPAAAATVDLRVLGPVGVQAIAIGAVNTVKVDALGLAAVGVRWRW